MSEYLTGLAYDERDTIRPLHDDGSSQKSRRPKIKPRSIALVSDLEGGEVVIFAAEPMLADDSLGPSKRAQCTMVLSGARFMRFDIGTNERGDTRWGEPVEVRGYVPCRWER